MGSGIIEACWGTRGALLEGRRTGNYSHDMKHHIESWARQKADELSRISKRKRKDFNTACIACDVETGRKYYCRSAGVELSGAPKNPLLFGSKGTAGLLPQASLSHLKVGNCAEVDAVNQALNNGAHINNLRIRTIWADEKHFGQDKPACLNCTHTFMGRVKVPPSSSPISTILTKRATTRWHRC